MNKSTASLELINSLWRSSHHLIFTSENEAEYIDMLY